MRSPRAALRRAARLVRDGSPLQARGELALLVTEHPDSAEMMAALARVNLLLDEPDEARLLALRALELKPLADALLVLARIAQREGAKDDALRRCYEALEQDITRNEAYEIIADTLEDLGMAEQALELIRTGLRRIPRRERTEALWRLARLEFAARKWQQAEKTLRRVARLVPDREEVWLRLSEVCGQLSRHEEAVRCALEALKINPRSQEALNILIAANAQRGALDHAVRAAESAVQVSPLDPLARFRLGVLLHQQGKLQSAIDQYSMLLAFSPDSAFTAAAHDAIANIEQYQMHQILLRSAEDAMFRMKLQRDLEPTLVEYGYALSGGLVAALRSVEWESVPHLQLGDRPARYH